MDQDHSIEFGGNRIYYSKRGKGLPVLMVHGFAEDHLIWDRQVTYLEKEFSLILPDLPGSGRSELFQDHEADLTMDTYASILKKLLDEEGISACSMIGHSMGGYIVLSFAEKYPDRLHSFSLFHSTAYADSEEKKGARSKSIDFIHQYGAAAFIRQTSPNLFSEYTRSSRPELVEELVKIYDNFNSDSLVSYYKAMMLRPDRTETLKQFNKPIQYLIGQHDLALPIGQSLAQCHLPKICYIHILEKAGHIGMWESTEQTNDFLHAFLKSTIG